MNELAPGGQFGPYRILSVIGYGGMGVVYLADDAHLDRRVALKVLAPQYTSDAAFRTRFERESRLAASLDHPNVVPVYDAGEVNGVLFIAMRYVAGADLRVVIDRDGPFPVVRALGIAAQLASALDAAHALGLIHRDVKPGNVLLAAGHGTDGGEHVYLTDFGLTKRSQSKSGLTQLGQLVGTIDYIAPEQIGGTAIDGRADIYALGCVFYEMLAGTAPYARETDLATMAAHLHEPPPKLTAVRPDLPPAADELMAKVLAKNPDERYASAADFVRAARAALAPDAQHSDTAAAGAAAAAAAAGAATVLTATPPPPPPPPAGPPVPVTPTVLTDTNVPYVPPPPPDAGPPTAFTPPPPDVSYPAAPPPTVLTSPPAPPPGMPPGAPPAVPQHPQQRGNRSVAPVALALVGALVILGLVAGAYLLAVGGPQATPTSISQASPSATVAGPTSPVPASSRPTPVVTPSLSTARPSVSPPTPTVSATPTTRPSTTPPQSPSTRPSAAGDPWTGILNPAVIDRATCTTPDFLDGIYTESSANLSCPTTTPSDKNVDRFYFLFSTQDELDGAWNKDYADLGENDQLCKYPDGTYYPHDWYFKKGQPVGKIACSYLDDGSPALVATYNHLKLLVIFLGVPGLNKDDVADVWSESDGVFAPPQ